MNLLSQQRNDSWSQYVNQVNYLNQANAYDTAARNVRKQGHQKIFGTLLGAAATAYGNGWIGGSGSKGQGTQVWVGSDPLKVARKNGYVNGSFITMGG